MSSKNTLILEIEGSPHSKKAIKMGLFLNGQEIKKKFQNVDQFLIGLDKILKANKMGITCLNSFKIQCSDLVQNSLSYRTAQVILKTIQYFNSK